MLNATRTARVQSLFHYLKMEEASLSLQRFILSNILHDDKLEKQKKLSVPEIRINKKIVGTKKIIYNVCFTDDSLQTNGWPQRN